MLAVADAGTGPPAQRPVVPWFASHGIQRACLAISNSGAAAAVSVRSGQQLVAVGVVGRIRLSGLGVRSGRTPVATTCPTGFQPAQVSCPPRATETYPAHGAISAASIHLGLMLYCTPGSSPCCSRDGIGGAAILIVFVGIDHIAPQHHRPGWAIVEVALEVQAVLYASSLERGGEALKGPFCAQLHRSG